MFTQLLNFKRALLAGMRNKRSHTRHKVGDEFPLKATLTLISDDSAAQRALAARGPVSGRVGDISFDGLSVVLPTSAELARKQLVTVRLSIESYSLEIPGSVVHFRVSDTHTTCGLKFKFADYKTQKAYHQLVEAVNIGASFAPSTRTSPGRTPPGFVRRTWRSAHRTVLTDWRKADSSAPERFEFVIGKHRLDGDAAQVALVVRSSAKGGTAPVPEVVIAELRQLLCWVVPNLSPDLPADLRALMTRVAGNNPPSLVNVESPSRWQAPKPKTLTVR